MVCLRVPGRVFQVNWKGQEERSEEMGLLSEKSAWLDSGDLSFMQSMAISFLLRASVIPTVKRGGRARSGPGLSQGQGQGKWGASQHLLFICTYILEFP